MVLEADTWRAHCHINKERVSRNVLRGKPCFTKAAEWDIPQHSSPSQVKHGLYENASCILWVSKLITVCRESIQNWWTEAVMEFPTPFAKPSHRSMSCHRSWRRRMDSSSVLCNKPDSQCSAELCSAQVAKDKAPALATCLCLGQPLYWSLIAEAMKGTFLHFTCRHALPTALSALTLLPDFLRYLVISKTFDSGVEVSHVLNSFKF